MDALTAFAPHADVPGAALLLSGAARSDTSRMSYALSAPGRIRAGRADGLGALDEAFRARAGFFAGRGGEGFSRGVAGLWGYELGALTEGASAPAPALANWPDYWIADYDSVESWPAGPSESLAPAPKGAEIRAADSRAAYEAKIEKAKAYIRAGDVFQVNLSQRFDAWLAEGDDPFAFFRRLSAASPASHALYARLDDDHAVVSNSPELFLSATPDGRIRTRPIKGTRPRGATPDEDARLQKELSESEKDRAENLMIVDLMRNDLSRVCRAGTISAPRLFEAEALANVHHLVSTVEGRLLPGKTVFDALAAAFPPGSVTGAPKSRALEIIAELEGETRGPYCGAFGFIDRGGAAQFSVLIRTVALARENGRWRAQFRSGGAITVDSDPAAEYEETLAKAGSIVRALGGSTGDLRR
ncbi:anthranilate synthase component I family protein [Euryhalocaulis caribicus]|uniref:anthranilate synthase component I family protein n=1 Tax=Euryhalocaulis caribicus TaxID=1161401 RepID=UPI0003A63D06|nr:anthranilate synthase component I family protein [Euryhalocaulis caribicus]